MGWTPPTIAGLHRGMESAEWASEALFELHVRLVERHEEARYQEQMARYHYLGTLPKMGGTTKNQYGAQNTAT
jgi:hypothetical protein